MCFCACVSVCLSLTTTTTNLTHYRRRHHSYHLSPTRRHDWRLKVTWVLDGHGLLALLQQQQPESEGGGSAGREAAAQLALPATHGGVGAHGLLRITAMEWLGECVASSNTHSTTTSTTTSNSSSNTAISEQDSPVLAVGTAAGLLLLLKLDAHTHTHTHVRPIYQASTDSGRRTLCLPCGFW